MALPFEESGGEFYKMSHSYQCLRELMKIVVQVCGVKAMFT